MEYFKSEAEKLGHFANKAILNNSISLLKFQTQDSFDMGQIKKNSLSL